MTEAEARTERDNRIAASDWTQVADAPLTQNERARWREYRQLLRDVPQQPTFPDVTWPAEPERDPVTEPGTMEE